MSKVEYEAEVVTDKLVGTSSDSPDHALNSLASSTRVAFEAPVLEKYTDMQTLLLVDPVHEVDDRGWPHEAPST